MPHFDPCKKCRHIACICPIVKGERTTIGPEKLTRTFQTGATRDSSLHKLDYEGFLSPLVLERFAQYMHGHRVQSDGQLRSSDNWQKGIPVNEYMKSLLRHVMELWLFHRGKGIEAQDTLGIQDTLCAILFNTQGFLFELLRPVVAVEVEVDAIWKKEEKEEATWLCKHCGRLNSNNVTLCPKCLWPKTTAPRGLK